MKVDIQDWRQAAFVAGMIGCVQFIVLTTIAMFLYPGGTHADPGTNGYSFWSNFFSDMGRSSALSGDANLASSILFSFALALAGLALVVFCVAMPRLFVKSALTRRIATSGTFFGVLSGIAYVGIAFTPSDRYQAAHGLFVNVAFTSFLLVVVLYSIAILLDKSYPNVLAGAYLGFAVILGVYLWVMFGGPDLETEHGLRIHATAQKTVVYAMILCMFIQGYGALRMLRRLRDVPGGS